jgi:hypothetical protein
MATALIKAAFVSGEWAPSLFGRVDLSKYASAASTLRNFFVSYRGGAYSRAGTAIVGFSKQTGRAYPPRLMTFQFSVNQGLALEFGNLYMRVISNGAFVSDGALPIENITQANPAVVTLDAIGGLSATANDGAISASYAAGDDVTLAGGLYTVPAVVNITKTELAGAAVNSPGTNGLGTGYAPGDQITAVGGTSAIQAVLNVATTQAIRVSLTSNGLYLTYGLQGQYSFNAIGGAGEAITIVATVVTVSGNYGEITSIDYISIAGSYTQNPPNLSSVLLSGDSFATGHSGFYATMSVAMGVQSVAVANGGVYTVNSATLTQGSTTGAGVGATFNNAIFGPNQLTFVTDGAYTTFPANPVAQASTTGIGRGATFNVSQNIATPFQTGDWVQLSGISGMTQLNLLTAVLTKISANVFRLSDVYGNNINSLSYSAYAGGGVAARIYTLSTIYAEADLKYLKITQSADVMSICCVNQQTLTEYPPQDLTRTTDSSWAFSPVVPAATIAAPTSAAATSAGGTGAAYYAYVVTAVASDGTESIASNVAQVSGSDIAAADGANTITWVPPSGANYSIVYKASPGFAAFPPAGAQYGFAGIAYGAQFIDANIIADFTQTPPTHQNPFARGQLLPPTITAPGSGYTSITYSIATSTGSGAILEGVEVGGNLVAFVLVDPGIDYLPTDTITITGVAGSGATATLNVGPQTGTYPSVPSYFQQRRVYGNTLNDPDTYFMSQPGSFTNFDSRIPTIASDAITGSPWSVAVDGIQWMINTPPGLVVMTGASAWLLVGSGSFATNAQPITPSTQTATPQAFSGCSPTVPPIKINYDLIYVTFNESLYYVLPYQLYALSEPLDLTEFSPHLFQNHTILEHAWCEQPYKILWAVRDDGILLSLTYLKAQQVAGWARHDTNGNFQTVCSVIEPPVNALYCGIQRFPGVNTAYMIERMDDRNWSDVDDCWCVDSGLQYPQPEPAATLSASSATGLGSLTGVTGLIGGENYSAGTTATVIDDNGEGPGSGAVAVLTIAGGVIAAVTFSPAGIGYTNPALAFFDPENTGSGASASPVLNNTMTFTASAPVFSPANVGSVIRSGGGMATVTAYMTATQVTANLTAPITDLIPNSGGIPQQQAAGNWTMTAPVSIVSGLWHLAGATVTGLADGQAIPPTVVSPLGQITLATPASAITIGLAFQAQLQSIFLDAGQSPTLQGQRKKIAMITARVEASRGFKIGTNQVDGSTLNPAQIAPIWNDLVQVPDLGEPPYGSSEIPLYTGDVRLPVPGGFAVPGQIAIQVDLPYPCQINALIPELLPGDQPDLAAAKREKGARR